MAPDGSRALPRLFRKLVVGIALASSPQVLAATTTSLIEDDELREAMAEKGLGTPATRASIIEGLIAENYLVRDGKELIPTPKAFQLLTLLRGLGVVPELGIFGEAVQLGEAALGVVPVKDASSAARPTAWSRLRAIEFRRAWDNRASSARA